MLKKLTDGLLVIVSGQTWGHLEIHFTQVHSYRFWDELFVEAHYEIQTHTIFMVVGCWFEVSRAERWSVERDPVLIWVLILLSTEVAVYKSRYVWHVLWFAPLSANHQLVLDRDVGTCVSYECNVIAIQACKVILLGWCILTIKVSQRRVALVINSLIDTDELSTWHVLFGTRYRTYSLSLITTDHDREVTILKSLVSLLFKRVSIVNHGSLIVLHHVDIFLRGWKFFWVRFITKLRIGHRKLILRDNFVDIFELNCRFGRWASHWLEPLFIFKPWRGLCCALVFRTCEWIPENFDFPRLL